MFNINCSPFIENKICLYFLTLLFDVGKFKPLAFHKNHTRSLLNLLITTNSMT